MKISGSTINGAGPKENRRELDFYPTPWECTAALLDFLKLPSCRIWEPACGDGAMSEVIKSYGHEVVSTDLRESGYGHSGYDFITAEVTKKFDAIITNPPFNIADQFIEKAIKHAPVVAMLLKSQYWHAKKRLELFERFPPTWVLPMTRRPDFLGGGSPTMDCMWTVWISGSDQISRYQPLNKPIQQSA